MIGLLIHLLILVLILGVAYWIVTLIPLPAPFRTVAMVIFAVICLIILVSLLSGGLAFPAMR